jgi:hypothetical protein
MRVLVSILLLGIGQSVSQTGPSPASDRAVYDATIAAAIRAEIDRLRGNASRVFTFDRTVAMCRPDVEPTRPLGCVRAEYIHAIETPLPRRQSPTFARYLSAATGRELARAFRERNRNNEPFPVNGSWGFVLVTPEIFQRELQTTPTAGTVRFSAPAYSADGHALLYGSYVCGGLCGTGWLFLLERRENSWQVVANESVWIS